MFELAKKSAEKISFCCKSSIDCGGKWKETGELLGS